MPEGTDPKPTRTPPVKHSAPISDRNGSRDDALSVERLRKADGRLLILYARRAGARGERS
jgi:hypothetical protein